ncbi:MAG: N-glycosylase/DNA lyase [archaeon]
MKKLLSDLKKLKVKKEVDNRIQEFENPDSFFSELCFCLLTANYNAEKAIQIQEKIGKGFEKLPEKELAKGLQKLGYRYPNIRAKYIVEARKHELPQLKEDKEYREWLVENVKGLGYKEASHFLRNIGYKDVAIVDFHIVDLLKRYNLTDIQKPITKSKYFEIEKILKTIAKKSNMTLAELDLYLWYMETGKILK